MSENLLNSDLVDILNDIEIMQQNNKDVTQVEIDDVVEKICDTLKNAATSAGVKQINSSLPPRSKKPNRTHTDQPWYNENCEKSRKIYFNFRNKYRKLRSSRNLSLLKIASKSYKKDIDKAFTDYHKKMITKIRNLKSSDPKSYWQIISKDSKSHAKINNISLEVFAE